MTAEQTTLKAAIIGLGFIGAGDQVSGDAIGQQVADLDGVHSHALAAHGQVELVAGSSRDEGRRRRFEQRTGVSQTYADWREMLAGQALDIVSVATNTPYHAEITIACAEAGVRAVFCDKPIATSLSDADRAISVCREHGTLLAINHQRRWNPRWRAARDEISRGTIGTVAHAVAHWPRGRIGNVGTHIFDALRMLLGLEAQAVSGTLDHQPYQDCRGERYDDPGGWGVIAFADGVKAFINAPHGPALPSTVRVVGSLGQLAVHEGVVDVELWDGSKRTVTGPDDTPDSMVRAVEDIVNCLRRGGCPADSGVDGLAALEIIIGFHVSDRLRGQWVSLPIMGADRDYEVLIG